MNQREGEMLSPGIKKLKPSPTLALSDKCAKLGREGVKVMNMGMGQSPFPVPDHMVEALKDNAHDGKYVSVKGLPELREAVADFHIERDGVTIKPDNVLFGPGAKPLVYMAQLAFGGDVIVGSPCWVSYIPQANMCGRRAHLVDTDFDGRFLLKAEQLAELCESEPEKKYMLILNHPCNPTSLSYTDEELRALTEVARDNDVVVLSDEIYGMLHHKGEHVSMAKYYPEGTVLISGLSKWGHAAGWRLGTASFPEDLEWLMGGMVKAAGQIYTCVPAPIQKASVAAYRGGQLLDDNLAHSRRILAALGKECADVLRATGVRVHASDGGFYIFPDFTPLKEKIESKGIGDSWTLCERLLEDKHVALTPGAGFERPAEELTARISYTNFDGAQAMAESERVGLDQPLPSDFIERYCAPTLEAVDRIVEWLNG